MAKVTMFHPQSGLTQEASESAYENVWSKEGWQKVAAGEPAQPRQARRRSTKPGDAPPADKTEG